MDETRIFDLRTDEVRTSLRGYALLRDPLLNKGTAFTEEERRAFRLEGLLPPRIFTLEEQLARVAENYARAQTDLDRYIFLRALQDRNETLFCAFVARRLEALVPIVYTPTVGEAVQQYSHIFRRPRGLYLHPGNIDRVGEVLRNYAYAANVRLIVATDSEGILGIGDQGAGGMGIPIGKLSLYVLGAGIHPSACLPITLDVGTNNETLLEDPEYLGWRHERLSDGAYFDFMEKFVDGLKAVLPNVLLQWEDLSKQNAFTLLEKYRKRILSFNDDIQGTGAVVLGGLLSALKIVDADIRDQRFVVLGAGAGGIGVTQRLYAGLVDGGLSETEAKRRLYVLDSRGLIVRGRDHVEAYKVPFAREPQDVAGWELADPSRVTLLDVVRNVRPTALFGTSGTAGAFDEAVVRAMAEGVEAPIIFPLSNPTSKAEAKPEDILKWTEGRAVVATGSPFPPVTIGRETHEIGQGNNVFVFPGIGLGTLVSQAQEVTEGMLTAAAYALRDSVTDDELARWCVYPSIERLREVTVRVATAVAEAAIEDGAAEPIDGDLEARVREEMWEPAYPKYIPVPRG